MPLTAIKHTLESRIETSKKLLTFIDKAELNAVSIEEIESVCVDVFGQKFSQPIQALNIFKASLKNTISNDEKLANLCVTKNIPLAIGELDLSLERVILTKEQIIKSFRAQSAEELRLTRLVSEEINFLTTLRADLKPHLPEAYQFFRKYVHFQLYNADYHKFKQHQIQQVNYQLNIAFDEKKCNALSRKFALKSGGQTLEMVIPFFVGKELDESLKVILIELGDIEYVTNEAIIKNATQIKQIMCKEDISFSDLVANAFGFYEVLCKLKDKMKVVFQKIDLKSQEDEIQLKLKICVNKVRIKLEKLLLEFANSKQKWTDLLEVEGSQKLQDETLNLILKKVKVSENVIEFYFLELQNIINQITISKNSAIPENLNDFNVKTQNKLNGIKKIIFQYQQAQHEYQSLSEALSRQKLLQEMLQEQKEKQIFAEKKQTQLFLWKAKVEESKKAREESQTKSLNIVVKPITQPVCESLDILIKKVDTLKHLSSRKIDLLKSIFCGDKGITYHEVYYLLTNKLGAKIVEQGNGSSHKTIIINNFSTCLMTNSQLPEVTKSGMLKPHTGAHQSGELSGFNLELIQIALEKSGITLEVIEALEEAKLNSKIACMTL